MELHAENIVPLDCCGEGFDVMRDGRCVCGGGSFVGVREVNILARLNISEETRGRLGFDRVPANMRNFFATLGKPRAVFGEDAEAGLLGSF
jgi:hypothetical protein